MIINLREITIGRDNACDIFLDDCCSWASRHHGSIYLDGNQLMFRDKSTNGTIINNIRVNKRTVPINTGDIIMIAGMYQISWSQINVFFPSYTLSQQIPLDNNGQQYKSLESVNTLKWNWGAFALYPLWGLFNGCWWGLFISVFLFYFFPIPNIIFGCYGTRWAWNNKKWNNAQEFIKCQSNWAVWGIIISCLDLFIFLSITLFMVC